MTGPEDTATPGGGKPGDREWVPTKAARNMVLVAHGWKLTKEEATLWLVEQGIADRVAFSTGSACTTRSGPVTNLARFVEEECDGSVEMAARSFTVSSAGLWKGSQLEELLRSVRQGPNTEEGPPPKNKGGRPPAPSTLQAVIKAGAWLIVNGPPDKQATLEELLMKWSGEQLHEARARQLAGQILAEYHKALDEG